MNRIYRNTSVVVALAIASFFLVSPYRIPFVQGQTQTTEPRASKA